MTLINIKSNPEEIQIKADLAVPLEKAWELLTNESHIANWWGSHVTLEPKYGGIFREVWLNNGRNTVTSGTITIFHPPSKLKMTWADDDWPGATTVAFSLIDAANVTTLTLHHSGWEIHPFDQQQQLIKNHTAGWSQYLYQLVTYSKHI